MSGWSGWYPFNRKRIQELRPLLNDEIGIYSLRIITNNGTPRSLNRIVQKDKSGILYYGKAVNLFRRLKECIRRFEGIESSPHSGAGTYLIYFSKTKWFKHGLIQFRWRLCKNEKEALKEETKSIRRYRTKFMDSPPLNSSE